MGSNLLASLKENAVFIKTPIYKKKMVMAVSCGCNVALSGLPFCNHFITKYYQQKYPKCFIDLG